MSETKAVIPELQELVKGREICARLKEYFHQLEAEFSHKKLPKRLQEMARNGFEISTGKDFSTWDVFFEQMNTQLIDWEKDPAQMEKDDFRAIADEWSELFKKVMSVINQAPMRAFELLKKKQTLEDVDKIFNEEGKHLILETLDWLNRLSGKAVKEKASEGSIDSSGGILKANLGMDNLKGFGWSKWAVETSGITKRYDLLEAVKNVTLTIEKGEIFGLLGPNGAGKTSLIECIEGIRVPDEGDVFILGGQFTGNENSIKEHIGVQLQTCNYYETLTVKEVLELYASFFMRNRNLDKLIELVELKEKRNTYVGRLSGGQKQRLALATALVNDPEVLFLDEPTTGLDPHGRRMMWETIKNLNEKGKTVFLTTHYMEEAEYLCNRVAIMDNGSIIAQDSPEELIKNHIAEQTLEISFSGTIPDSTIKAIPGVNRFWKKNRKIMLITDDQKAALTHIMDLKSKNENIEDITLRRGNLEDVFLKLTNRGLDQ